MKASEIRALFAVASRPEVVSLAGGMPNISGLPLDAVADTIDGLVRERGAEAMQYSSGQGDPVLREQICEVMALEGIAAHPDDVVVTVGSQQAVDLVTRVFCDPGDVVLCEAPSYVGALGVFRAYECEVVHVDDGRRRPGPGGASSRRSPPCGRRQAGEVPVHDPELPQPGRRHNVAERASRGPGDLPRGRPAGPRGQPVRAAGLRRAIPLPAMRVDRRRAGGLPRLVLEDVRARASGSAGRSPRTRSARSSCSPRSRRRCARRRSASSQSRPTCRARLARQIKDFSEMYRERRDAMLAALSEHMPAGTTWTVPARRVLCLGHPARGPRLAGDAAARGHRPRRLRARDRLLRRRLRVAAACA